MGSKNKNLVIVRSVLEQGLTHAQAAERYQVFRQWVHILVQRYQLGGPEGLEPRSRAPRSRPGTTPEAVRQKIIALRKTLTSQGADAGPATIAWHLDNDGFDAPSTATIHRILHAHGLITPEPRKRPRSSYRRFEAELPNECWQADITHAFLATGEPVEILDFLDDHSRYLLHIQAAPAFSGAMVVTAMNQLISTYGPPASTLTDNALVFTARLAGRRGGRNGFEKLLQAHRIRQKNGRPGHPQTQGKIERFHQTLKRWLTSRPRPDSIQDLQALLEQFQTWYNTKRPHRATGRRTPAQAYTALPKATPGNALTEPEWRPRVDRVDKNGKVSLRYAGQLRHLGYGRAHAGRHVLILVHDDHAVTSDATTGEIIAEHRIDPTRDYQPKLHRTHNTPTQTPHPSQTANPHKKPESRHHLSTMSRLRTRADSATKIPSCEFKVPAEAKTGDTYTARLKVTAGNPDPANDLVLAMDAFAVARDYLVYDPVDAKKGEEATSEPKFDNPATEFNETKPEKAKFELGKLPEGVTEDQVKVDPKTGVVTFTPKPGQENKTFKFPVVMRDENLQIPVLDENGDPVLDDEGNPKTQGRIVARGEAVFNVDEDGDGVAPDPDGNNDGEADDPNAPEADSQHVTFSVKIDGKIVESDGNNDTAEELPESVRDVVVTLTAEDGTEYKSNDNGETWRGAKDYPVVQNLGLKDIPKGKYTVSVAGLDDINKDDLKLKADSQLREGATIEITGNTPNLFVELETIDSKNYEPGYEDGSGKPGEDVTVPAPGFKDKDGKDTTAPEGTTFKPGENVPGGVTVDPSTGEVTVKVPEGAEPGSKITVPVVVTYPDGSTDEVEVSVTVEQPDAPETTKPDWKDDSGKPSDKVEIPNTGGSVPDGSTVGTEGPGKAEIDENGNLVVDIDKDAKPGDKVVVIVKDKDGNEIDSVTVTVEKPSTPAEKPEWKDGKTMPDKPIVIPNEGGKVPDGATVEVTGPGTAEIGKDGSITVTPSDKAKVGDKIVVVVKDKDCKILDTITVEITEGELKPEGPKPGQPLPGMPSTGADDSAAGTAALGGVLAAVAAGVAAARRRQD